MDMRDFIAKINDRNFGVVSFNTYMQDNMNHCFIMVAERGDKGTFFKRECPYYSLNNMLKSLLIDIDRLIQTKK